MAILSTLCAARRRIDRNRPIYQQDVNCPDCLAQGTPLQSDNSAVPHDPFKRGFHRASVHSFHSSKPDTRSASGQFTPTYPQVDRRRSSFELTPTFPQVDSRRASGQFSLAAKNRQISGQNEQNFYQSDSRRSSCKYGSTEPVLRQERTYVRSQQVDGWVVIDLKTVSLPVWADQGPVWADQGPVQSGRQRSQLVQSDRSVLTGYVGVHLKDASDDHLVGLH